MRKILSSTLVLAAASAALAGDLPDGIGVITPSGSVFTTEITGSDTDDYVFQGYPGMKVTATVKVAKGSLLVPQVQIIRPGGTLVGDEEGLSVKTKPTSVKATATLDAIGWWKVRVAGASSSTGAYSVTVKYTSPAPPPLPLASKSFGAAAAITPAGDEDSFDFQGYDGQSLKTLLTIPKGSALDAAVQVIRPDGTVLIAAGRGTTEFKIPIETTLNATGTWHLKVVGDEIDSGGETKTTSTGAYTLSVKLGRFTSPGLSPDANRQYRFTIPASGGATIAYKLTATAAAGGGQLPTYNSIVGPDGKAVVGFPGGLAPRAFKLLETAPFGLYTVTFDAPAGPPPLNVKVTRSVKPPSIGKKRSAKLSEDEPILRNNGITPVEGGPGTVITVIVDQINDPNFQDESDVPDIQLGHIPLEDVTRLDPIRVKGTVPVLPEGVFDVVVMSTSGQPDAKAGAFRRVPPPQVTSIDPTVGSSAGGFPITITGTGFRPGRMGILLDGDPVPVLPTETTEGSITFIAPPRAPGFVIFGVEDLDSQLFANLGIGSFEYVAAAAISRLVPTLIPILGNEVITVQGANFSATDTVYVETTTPGVYQRMNDTQTTFVNSKAHQFDAPIRPKGVYRVHVQDAQGQPNPPKTRNLTYYSFADFTSSTNLGTLGGADPYDGITTALTDFDGDGDQDLFISRSGNPGDTSPAAASLTRVLRNDAGGVFADVSASVMPATTVDDWRADRIWAADINQDGRSDLILSTNTFEVPDAGLSHTRILVNEPRGGSAGAGDRVFRDRTLDLMPPPREMQKYGIFGGDASTYVADDWRGLDMWVGDIDKGGAGPPEIVITHDEVKNDDNPHSDVFSSGVYCGNYCNSQQPFPYSYTFYWGGSRLFVWDKTANAGQGRYKFDPNFFPRESGPVVPQYLPTGGTIPACSPHYARICKASFTPFTGKRLAVGHLDTDGKPDVAVITDQTIQRRDKPNDPLEITSSLQVGINKFNQAEGSGITDLTGLVHDIGGVTRGEVVAIGQPGFPDGNSYGVIAFGRATSAGGPSVLRLLKFKPNLSVGEFEDITSASLAAADATDQFQASRLSWLDIDADGDQDLVLLANAPPGNVGPALRILRNERVSNTVGNLRRTLEPLFTAMVSPGEHFEGDALSIGDVTGDGFLDYIVTRATPSGAATDTRIVETDR
jgi:hypothetical protein